MAVPRHRRAITAPSPPGAVQAEFSGRAAIRLAQKVCFYV
jgi:hypothetical protein